VRRAALAAVLLLVLPVAARAADAPAPDSLGAEHAAVADSAALAPAVTTTAPGNAPTHVRKGRVSGGGTNVVRTGPGESFAIATVVNDKAEFAVVAKHGDWYGVRLSDTETGWIHASLCKEFDDLSDLEWRPNPKLYSRTGSFIVGGYLGGYSFDRKSNSLVVGGRLGYYVFDRLQFEGGVGWTHVHRPAEIVESLFGVSLEAEDFGMLFYHLVASWELLPGRQMVPYLSAGVGSTIMQGESEPSYDFGAGTTLYLSKRAAMRWEVRNYRFDSGSSHARRTNNNFEFTLGSLVLF